MFINSGSLFLFFFCVAVVFISLKVCLMVFFVILNFTLMIFRLCVVSLALQ